MFTMQRYIMMSALILLIILGLGYWWFGFHAPKDYERTTVTIRNRTFEVDIADTVTKQVQGLSGRPSLGENEGMLFIFSGTSDRAFWMKDMNFPIDMIWIKGDRVAGFTANAMPEPEKSVFSLTLYKSPEPVDKVLEVPAGTAQKLQINVGDTVAITNR